MPTKKFAGMNVLQPVGLLPRAANASRQPSSSQTAWTPHSQRLMTAPAIRPEPISRGQDGCFAITCSPELLRTSRPPNDQRSPAAAHVCTGGRLVQRVLGGLLATRRLGHTKRKQQDAK